jgi:hypothetical protein
MVNYPRTDALDLVHRIDPTQNVHIRKAMALFFAGRPEGCRGEIEKAEKLAQGVDQLTLIIFAYAWLKDFDATQRILTPSSAKSRRRLASRNLMLAVFDARANRAAARAEANHREA